MTATAPAASAENAKVGDVVTWTTTVDGDYGEVTYEWFINTDGAQRTVVTAEPTVDITLKEEDAPELTDTTVSLGDRIGAALHTGWDALTGFVGDAAVFLVAALPFIVIVAVVVIVVKLIKRRHK